MNQPRRLFVTDSIDEPEDLAIDSFTTTRNSVLANMICGNLIDLG